LAETGVPLPAGTIITVYEVIPGLVIAGAMKLTVAVEEVVEVTATF
jgi:hypothetical protein